MKILNFIKKIKRYLTIKKRSRKLKTKAFPSIIANNCCGGVIYHDLNQRFTSPTINLYFNHEDFLNYVLNLRDYCNAELVEDLNAQEKFPVGILKKAGFPEVKIFFMHYPNFAAAKEKWIERTKRIDVDNVLVIFDSLNFEINKNQVELFNEIKFRKVIFIKKDFINVENSFVFDKFVPDYEKGETLLNYLEDNKFYQWRYLDYFDYVEFINTGKIRNKLIRR